LPVGAITSLFGSPLFIILLMRMNSQRQLISQ
jgi:ABC-type Fe3+-siderophore transport system permease subunit